MGERASGIGSLIFTVLIFIFLMLFMVPQFRTEIPQGELGLLENISQATGIATWWIAGAMIAGTISLGVFLVSYLLLTGKLSELL